MDIFGLGKKTFLSKAESLIKSTCKDGRFLFTSDKIEYTEKSGKKVRLDIDAMSGYLLDMFSNQLTDKTKDERANPALLGVEPDDIKKILVKLKGK